MGNEKQTIEMFLTDKIKSGNDKEVFLEIQLLYSNLDIKKEFTISILNKIQGKYELYTTEMFMDPVNLNEDDYFLEPSVEWIKNKIKDIYVNNFFIEDFSDSESNQITISLINNLIKILKGQSENYIKKAEGDKLLKKIKDNLKKFDKVKKNNSEKRTHLRNLDFQQNLVVENIIRKYIDDYKFLSNIVKWFYDEKFERKSIYNLFKDLSDDFDKIKHIIDTVYENNFNFVGENEIKKIIMSDIEYDTLFDIINLSQLSSTRISHSISDNTSIVSNPETFKVEKEVATESKGNVNYFVSTIIESIPVEIIKYDNTILHEPVTFKIKWKSKNNVFTTPSHEEGYNIKEIKDDLINRGEVINAYDVIPALTALIKAFDNRNLIKIKKDIQKPGFYFDAENNEIKTVNYEIKDYRKDIIQATKVLDSLKEFYIDNLDKLATILKWGWISPFFYAMKQRGNQSVSYLCLSGIADTGKTTVAEIVLYLWGEPLEGINEVSGAKAGSVARLGNLINSGTFPIVINETEDMFKRLNMVEMIKTSVFGLIARSRYEGNVIKNFAALSPLIFTQNGYLPEDDGIIRRFNDIRFGLNERKSKNDKLSFQSIFQMNHHDVSRLNKLKSISYFIAEEIINEPKLLDNDYEKLALLLLHRLYDNLNLKFPLWLNKSVEKYNVNEIYDIQEETIRTFLAYTINKAHVERITDATYTSDGIDKYLNLDRDEGIDLRVDTVLSRQLVPWIIAKKNRQGEIIVCLTVEFAKQLKEYTAINHQLKTLGEIMGFNYGNMWFGKKTINNNHNQKRVIWANLDDFKLYLFPDSEDS